MYRGSQGALCAALLAWTERQAGRRALVVGAVVIVLGIVAWTMPS
ncbi:MAG TPA: hypothetical protein VF818_06980 [Ktedonobacterales bacterium]